MIHVDMAIHVGDLKLGFVDGGFECHGDGFLGSIQSRILG
jgi:hypothetical protein